MDSKKFIGRLNLDEWNYLLNNNIDPEFKFEVKVVGYNTPKTDWTNEDKIKMFLYGSLQSPGRFGPFLYNFYANDFYLHLDHGLFQKDLSKEFQLLLASKFGEEYTRELFNYKVEIAKKEVDSLLENAKNQDKKYLLK